MNIETFYSNVKQTCSWPSLYYGIVSNIINANNYKKCVEVGIGYGFHAKEILKNTQLEQLYLVDPMKWYPNDDFPKDILSMNGTNPFDDLVGMIKQELSSYENRYTWFRVPSLDITQEQIPDDSLDIVFLDADHSFLAVISDLHFWWKKLKKGGELLGDDFYMESVSKAVKQFSKDINQPFSFIYKNDYVIYSFLKI